MGAIWSLGRAIPSPSVGEPPLSRFGPRGGGGREVEAPSSYRALTYEIEPSCLREAGLETMGGRDPGLGAVELPKGLVWRRRLELTEDAASQIRPCLSNRGPSTTGFAWLYAGVLAAGRPLPLRSPGSPPLRRRSEIRCLLHAASLEPLFPNPGSPGLRDRRERSGTLKSAQVKKISAAETQRLLQQSGKGREGIDGGEVGGWALECRRLVSPRLD